MPAFNIHEKVVEAIAYVVDICGRMVPKPKAMRATNANQLVAEWYPDDRIHKAPPGADRANFRSATPCGFAQAAFNANRPDQLRIAA